MLLIVLMVLLMFYRINTIVCRNEMLRSKMNISSGTFCTSSLKERISHRSGLSLRLSSENRAPQAAHFGIKKRHSRKYRDKKFCDIVKKTKELISVNYPAENFYFPFSPSILSQKLGPFSNLYLSVQTDVPNPLIFQKKG